MVNIVTILGYGFIGIGMARQGYGVWSLVGAQLTSVMLRTVCLWGGVAWRPKWIVSRDSIAQMFGFSSRILGSQLLTSVFNNIYTLVIGKLFLPAMLGFYTRGYSLAVLAINSVNGTISSVLFPALSSCQGDPAQVKRLLRRAIQTSTFVLFPLLAGMVVMAKPLILLVLTEKWLPAVPFLQISCLTVAFWPIIGANTQGAMALGRAGIVLRLEIVNKGLALIVVAATAPFGIMAMVSGQAVFSAVQRQARFPEADILLQFGKVVCAHIGRVCDHGIHSGWHFPAGKIGG